MKQTEIRICFWFFVRQKHGNFFSQVFCPHLLNACRVWVIDDVRNKFCSPTAENNFKYWFLIVFGVSRKETDFDGARELHYSTQNPVRAYFSTWKCIVNATSEK